MSDWWLKYSKYDVPHSESLKGYIKTGNNLFFTSDDPISKGQIHQILYTLVDHGDARFIKIDTPNLKKSFSATYEAEDYLKNLVTTR